MNGDLRIISQSCSSKSTVVVGIGHAAVQIAVCGHCCLLVPEPFGGYSAEVCWGHVADSSCRFGARNDSIEIGGLFSVVAADFAGEVARQQVIEIFVSGSEDFGLI